jgi:hypothetical protein
MVHTNGRFENKKNGLEINEIFIGNLFFQEVNVDFHNESIKSKLSSLTILS